jgi:hypothetical protein
LLTGVLSSDGLSGIGAPLSGCDAGVTEGVFTSGFGVSAAIMIFSVMEMTFHVQPKEISRQNAAIARAASSIEAALRFCEFNYAEVVLFAFIELAIESYVRK